MAKTKKKNSLSPTLFFKIFKKSSITGIILLLLAALYEVGDGAYKSSQVELPSSKNPVQLYSNQTNDHLSQVYLTAIKNAKESIDLVIYSLLDQRVIAALEKKATEGIPVHIVCDAKACPGILKKIPHATIIRRIPKGLTHQKILILDKKSILLGSANMTHDSLEVHGNLVIGLESASLAELMILKIRSMDEEGGFNPLMYQTLQAGNQTLELWELPDNRDAADRIKQLLRSAKKSINVAMFTWTRQDFTEELIAAKNRGVKVSTVIDRYSGKGASAKIVSMLQRNKIPVHFNTSQGLLHHKFAYIDEKILINGSANWTNAAFKDNDDVFMVIQPLTENQVVKMNMLWKNVWGASEPA